MRPGAISKVAGSKDVVLVPFDQHFRAGEAGIHGPGSKEDCEVDVLNARAEDRHDHDDQNQERKCDSDIDDAHQ